MELIIKYIKIMILNKTIIKANQPLCKTCKLPMQKWHPFEDVNEHVKCTSYRISGSLVELLMDDLGVYR